MTNGNFQTMPASPRFRGEILHGVYRVWLLRRFLPTMVAEVLVFSFIIYELAQAVFVKRVLENALNVFFENPARIISFFTAAFLAAPLATKVLSIGAAVLIALILRQLTQGFLRLILVKQNYFAKVEK